MGVNTNRFTEKSQEAVLGAQQLAESLNHSQVEPEHLLAVLLPRPTAWCLSSSGGPAPILNRSNSSWKPNSTACQKRPAPGGAPHGRQLPRQGRIEPQAVIEAEVVMEAG
jgi:hypothetical protein